VVGSLCYVRAAVTPGPAIWSATVTATALAIAGCGGDARGGTGVDEGDGTVAIERVAFPARQRVGQPTSFVMTLRNGGDTRIRNLVVSLRGFSRHTSETPQRPLWLVDDPPAGSATALDDTYVAGPLQPGRHTTLRWRVTAVVAGSHEIAYAVAGARLAGGGRPVGKVTVRVTQEPAFARVDPRTGAVIRNTEPSGG